MNSIQRLVKPALLIVCLGIAAMWVYAFGFASKESVNRIGDTAWQQYAESRCAVAKKERIALADMRKVNEVGPEALRERATIVDKATDTLERAIDDISAQSIADEKGRAIVPLWLADYRTYIADRRAYTEQLRRGDREAAGPEDRLPGGDRVRRRVHRRRTGSGARGDVCERLRGLPRGTRATGGVNRR